LNIEYGQSLTKSERDQTSDIPVYGSSGIVGNHNQPLIDGPCIIVGRKGSAGEVHYSQGPCWPIDTTYYIQVPSALSPLYVYYALRSLNLESLDKSTTIPSLSRDDFYAQFISIPPLPEQHRIVDAIETQFTRLDAAVAALKRIQTALERYRASVLKAACEGRLTPTEAALARAEGREYEPAGALLTRILAERRARWEGERWQYEIERAKKKAAQAERKAAGLPYYIRDLAPEDWQDIPEAEYADYLPKSDRWKHKYKEPEAPDTEYLPDLPEGWVWTKLGQIFGVYVGATPRRNRPEYWNGSINWVSSGEVAFCRVRSTRETITELGLDNSSTELHPPGTVLLGMIGEGKTRGQVAILDIAATHNQNSAAIRVSEANLPPEYIYYFLTKEYERTRTRGSGGNQPALNKSRVQSIPLPLPPLPEQRRIVAEVERRLSLIEALETAVARNLRRAERLRQSILKRAFAGRLVPQDPGDEPAAALLARVRAEREQADGQSHCRRQRAQKRLPRI